MASFLSPVLGGKMAEHEEEFKIVTFRYADLENKDSNLTDDLEKGFGPDGLGIIGITDVPGYPESRKKLLRLAEKLAHLPEESLRKIQDPESGYSFGWSHGAEKFYGKPDFAKGSFYANVCQDVPTNANPRYISQCRTNLWPSEDLPELEPAFKEMGSLIKAVGYLLAYHCDKYQYQHSGRMGVLESTLRRSQAHKARLLYYYPVNSGSEHSNGTEPQWCGWHCDFGSLTGLTAGMYTKDGVEVTCPDSDAGLYIKTNKGRIVRAVYDENCLAFQVGETTEVLSEGIFHATPHCVQTPKRSNSGVGRSTFALFMQPSWEEILVIPESMRQKVPPGAASTTSLTFGEYSDICTKTYLMTESQ
ncbi:hypothetical protein R1sor_017604 [Riccia sorocarpa]|uniref:Non-haem dioxygenase N-terminal domain-containing protein n=1 Tax=Riccia sorocarpa TaxID=122646 RepID=A0ABD3IBD2_9MARC